MRNMINTLEGQTIRHQMMPDGFLHPISKTREINQSINKYIIEINLNKI